MQIPVEQVRIDIPLIETYAYLFFDPTLSIWNEWWQSLFEHVLRLIPDDPAWEFEPVQQKHYTWVELTDHQKTTLLELLRDAPEDALAQHKTLRRASQLPLSQAPRLRLMVLAHSTN
jgi:hypothetical protein